MRAYKRVKLRLKLALDQCLGSKLGPATVMYYFHAEIRYWLNEQWDLYATGAIAPPDLSAVFRMFDKSNNLQWLPETTLVLQFQALHKSEPRYPAPQRRDVGADRNPQLRPESRPTTASARNLNRDSRYVGETPLAIKIKSSKIPEALKRGAPPPAAPKGPVAYLGT